MRTPHSAHVLFAALAPALVVALLTTPASGSEAPREDAAAAHVAPVSRPVHLAGVDLRGLGYTGPDIAAFDLGAIDRPLPDGFVARSRALGHRLDLLGPQRTGLASAVPLLEGAVRAMEPRIHRQRRQAALATARAELAGRRLVEVRQSVGRRREALEAHRARMAESVVAVYVRPPGADTVGGLVDGLATDADQLAAPVLHQAKIEHDLDVEDRGEVALATAVVQEAHRAEELRVSRAAAVEAERRLERLVSRRAALVFAREHTRGRRRTVEARVQWIHNELDALAHVLFRTESGTPAWARLLHDVPVRQVGGIRVHVAVSHRLESLLMAARADGIVLRGWGHRSHARQIELRRAHCGPSEDDVWSKPSGMCSPPTAVPGRSMHELGLAVDFTHDGEGITSRSSPAYRWLARHAPLYGFANLPSEPWHWSLNGR